MKMKQILALLTFWVGFSIFTPPVNPQSCYMVNENGEQVNLNGLCDNKNNATQTITPGVFQSPIKRRQGGIPIIDVSFNNQETVEMMVDTGASATVLPSQVAQRVGVEPEGTVVANTPSQKRVKFPAGRVTSINAGGAIAQDVIIVISPALSIGLLGQNFFRRYDVSIKENVVEFRDR